jgi:hypothetical protein
MKTIFVLAIFIVIGYVLWKVVFPIIFKLLKYLLAAVIPIVIIVGIAIMLFVGAAAFVGMTRSVDEDGGTPIAEKYEQVEEVNKKIEGKIDSMEGGWLDTKIRNWQDKINSK